MVCRSRLHSNPTYRTYIDQCLVEGVMYRIYLNCLSEIIFVWEKHIRHVSCLDGQTRPLREFCFYSGAIGACAGRMWSLLNCKCNSSESKCCTVNISRPPLSPCVALVSQFLHSPRVALKFKTLKWAIIEEMSLMVHSLSVQWQLLLIKALHDENEGFPWRWTRAFMCGAQWERIVC